MADVTGGRRALSVLLGAMMTVAALAAAPPARAQEAEPAPCTSVVTPAISTFRIGTKIGLGTGPALVPSLVNTGLAFPGQEIPGSEELQELLNEIVYPSMFDVAAQLSESGLEFLTAMDEAAAPFGQFNEQFDAGVTAFGQGLVNFSNQYKEVIEPFDLTARQMGELMLGFTSENC